MLHRAATVEESMDYGICHHAQDHDCGGLHLDVWKHPGSTLGMGTSCPFSLVGWSCRSQCCGGGDGSPEVGGVLPGADGVGDGSLEVESFQE
ncbi:hypothetical protein GH714_028954 [Hevea brasiliensis]|uniref:Uncharacterized protein n=1 Tax=Hevea brasiliensis TaxID=3981 RepID=A0A6A6KXU2_HEVBR|nr:hypothetical protein GH714_028954 [Hevea brasiliensis]